jgi:hypothetical protein
LVCKLPRFFVHSLHRLGLEMPNQDQSRDSEAGHLGAQWKLLGSLVTELFHFMELTSHLDRLHKSHVEWVEEVQLLLDFQWRINSVYWEFSYTVEKPTGSIPAIWSFCQDGRVWDQADWGSTQKRRTKDRICGQELFSPNSKALELSGRFLART